MDNTSIIFGSSFDDDQGYQQICLNINRIKIAMELGRTVVLCNLEKLYESLYDALNQVRRQRVEKVYLIENRFPHLKNFVLPFNAHWLSEISCSLLETVKMCWLQLFT